MYFEFLCRVCQFEQNSHWFATMRFWLFEVMSFLNLKFWLHHYINRWETSDLFPSKPNRNHFSIFTFELSLMMERCRLDLRNFQLQLNTYLLGIWLSFYCGKKWKWNTSVSNSFQTAIIYNQKKNEGKMILARCEIDWSSKKVNLPLFEFYLGSKFSSSKSNLSTIFPN